MERNETYDKILHIIEEDREELVNLCCTLDNMPSPHGKERNVAEAILDWLKMNDIDED